MEDRNKDLPLIVSEILIEMHEMKEGIREMNQTLTRVASVVVKQQEHMSTMFSTFQEENKKNMEYMTSLIADVQRDNLSLIHKTRQENLELITGVRQENITLIAAIRQQNKEDREFLTYSLNKTLGQQQQTNGDFEKRLAELEAKYNG
ncbi:hypothetical protein GCM10022408_22370 [Hymenobacter fastidiosus]|uniref:Uncharacterized protein n=1 Tax=Hymenobacter fastidiosus TaxID=486264 RepID=A0ABP7SCA1_9BACT